MLLLCERLLGEGGGSGLDGCDEVNKSPKPNQLPVAVAFLVLLSNCFFDVARNN